MCADDVTRPRINAQLRRSIKANSALHACGGGQAARTRISACSPARVACLPRVGLRHVGRYASGTGVRSFRRRGRRPRVDACASAPCYGACRSAAGGCRVKRVTLTARSARSLPRPAPARRRSVRRCAARCRRRAAAADQQGRSRRGGAWRRRRWTRSTRGLAAPSSPGEGTPGASRTPGSASDACLLARAAGTTSAWRRGARAALPPHGF